jgi:predicted transcriptional regulator
MADDEDPPSFRARTGDPWTSHAAAEDVSSEMTSRHYSILLRTIRRYGPGTMYDIADHCELSLAQVHKRLPEMERRGWVWRPGDTAYSPSMRSCKIWHEGRRPVDIDEGE